MTARLPIRSQAASTGVPSGPSTSTVSMVPPCPARASSRPSPPSASGTSRTDQPAGAPRAIDAAA